ncbi:MAG: hypothetical protein LBV21_01225 [Candidatus Adiutrix sp.]|jgi:hypothetical protein|nr:hypothetical protein [Candidatus Adiutrix sp.]
MTNKSKKTAKGKWNFLVMRSKGEVTTLSISPLILALALMFALLFTAAAIVTMNLYFNLYLDFRDLDAAHRKVAEKLERLDDQYKYQISVAKDYAELMGEADWPNRNYKAPPAAEPDRPLTSAPEVEAAAGEPVPGDPLLAWAAALPDPLSRPEEGLDIDNFRVDGNRFSFQLVNDTPGGNSARGRLLTLFLVETEGRTQAVPFPDFDARSPNPDFEAGLGYNIRASKTFPGQLKVPAGSEIMAMMVVAQASDGRIVMKKRVAP